MNSKHFLIIILFMSFFLNACSSFTGDEDLAISNYIFNENIDPVLAENAQNIMASKCLSCHFENSQSGYLNFPELINDGYITQGPANRTVLYRCINSECITRDGSRTANMAVNGNLTSQEVTILNDFMEQLFIYTP